MEINDAYNENKLSQLNSFNSDLLFTDESQIKEIYENTNPIGVVYEMIESHHRRIKGRIIYDSNVLTAISEFHVNNLIFLKQTFNFPDKIYCKLLNLLSILLNLRDDNEDLSISKKSEKEENFTEDEELKEDQMERDFVEICRNKLSEIKNAFFNLNLIPKKNSQTREGDNNFYLKNSEISTLLDYIKTFYFPFIRLYYHFINIEKITETKKIDVVINHPLPVPPLTLAVLQAQEKHHYEEQKIEKVAIEEGQTSQSKKEEVKKEEEIKKEEIVETYQDVMNRLNINNETRKIISEKIEELQSEVNHKIAEREKKLESRLKEIEDQIKGKKK